MFQALGVHGPVLTPLGSALLDITLVSVAFAFFVGGSRTNRMTMGMLATMVVAMAALRVLMQPLPNVQPVTVAALLVGAHLGADEVWPSPSLQRFFPTCLSAMGGGPSSKPQDGPRGCDWGPSKPHPNGHSNFSACPRFRFVCHGVRLCFDALAHHLRHDTIGVHRLAGPRVAV